MKMIKLWPSIAALVTPKHQTYTQNAEANGSKHDGSNALPTMKSINASCFASLTEERTCHISIAKMDFGMSYMPYTERWS